MEHFWKSNFLHYEFEMRKSNFLFIFWPFKKQWGSFIDFWSMSKISPFVFFLYLIPFWINISFWNSLWSFCGMQNQQVEARKFIQQRATPTVWTFIYIALIDQWNININFQNWKNPQNLTLIFNLILSLKFT